MNENYLQRSAKNKKIAVKFHTFDWASNDRHLCCSGWVGRLKIRFLAIRNKITTPNTSCKVNSSKPYKTPKVIKIYNKNKILQENLIIQVVSPKEKKDIIKIINIQKQFL